MSEKKIILKVARTDPASGGQSHFQSFEVPSVEGMSVMQALDYIYEHLDASLAYYDHAACAQGICARCSILINSKTGLMCQTPAQDGMTLQTPGHSKIIKDLVYNRKDK